MSKIHSPKILASKIRSPKIRPSKSRSSVTDRASRTHDDAPLYPRVFAAMMFSFHRVCSNVCRRAQRCTGGVHPPCFVKFWPHVPPRDKAALRAMVAARLKGASLAEAVSAGEAAAVFHDTVCTPPSPEVAQGVPEIAAEVPPPVPARTREHVRVRVRSL
jgi:hypothetical protein